MDDEPMSPAYLAALKRWARGLSDETLERYILAETFSQAEFDAMLEEDLRRLALT